MFQNRGKHRKKNVFLDKSSHNISVYFSLAFVLVSQSVGSCLCFFVFQLTKWIKLIMQFL